MTKRNNEGKADPMPPGVQASIVASLTRSLEDLTGQRHVLTLRIRQAKSDLARAQRGEW